MITVNMDISTSQLNSNKSSRHTIEILQVLANIFSSKKGDGIELN